MTHDTGRGLVGKKSIIGSREGKEGSQEVNMKIHYVPVWKYHRETHYYVYYMQIKTKKAHEVIYFYIYIEI